MAGHQQVEFLQHLKMSMMNTGEEFSEVRTWYQKTGLTAEKAAEKCLEKMVNILYQYLSEGILQLTVEEIAKQKECADAKERGKKKARVAELKATLPSLSTYLEFVINAGSLEVAKIHYDFEAAPEIEEKCKNPIRRKQRQENHVRVRYSNVDFVFHKLLHLLAENQQIRREPCRCSSL
jgi:hypothetical protein